MSFRGVALRGKQFLDQYPRDRLWWGLLSRLTIGSVGLVSKLFVYGRHRVTITNGDVLQEAIHQAKLEGRGLVTFMNHVSVLDDPLVWGMLPSKWYFQPHKMRWTLGAEDIVFRNTFERMFFSLGQVLAVRRFGAGPFQPALDGAISLLNRSQWVHVYPEGFVHQPWPPHEHTLKYFRWGVSRLLLEADRPPVVVPLYSRGLEQVFPENKPKRFIGYGKNINIQYAFGMPLDNAQVAEWRQMWQDLSARYNPSVNEQSMPSQLIADSASLRSEVANGLRRAVLAIKDSLGDPEEDPRLGSHMFWRANQIKPIVKLKGLTMLEKVAKSRRGRHDNIDL